MIKLSAFSDEAGNSLEQQIAALQRNNIPYMEIRNIDGKNIKDLSLQEAQAIKDRLDEEGLKVWSVGSPLGKVDITVDMDEYMETVCHIFELAKILGADKIRMFSFFNSYDQKDKVIHNLKLMVAKANEYGIKLCHENEKEIYGDTATRVKEILDNVPGLYCVYDPANFLQVGEKADTTLPLFADRTEYFHIKDVIMETEELVPAGEGDGNIPELIASIQEDKVLSLEPHLAVFEGYSTIDNTQMKNKYHFASNSQAFDAAANALKQLLIKAGYKETKGGFVK
ncbi:MAG: sugar phosphate isomerase/epimerase [Ruminococcaceae bacterium]|nr:sugar phosphate isomerase/epimerase [Oscillospiraceae bacterium]